MTNKIKIAFFGTPEFAIPTLETLCNSGFAPELVVTAAADKKNGQSPVGKWAESRNMKIYAQDELSEEALRNFNLFIIAAYGKLLSDKILSLPSRGCLNIHPSLLPKYRGASPIQSAILAGENETGVTIIIPDSKMDHGPIVAQETISMPNCADSISLTKILSKLAAELAKKTVPRFLAGGISASEQNHKDATFTKLLQKKDGKINWSQSASAIERQIRAYKIWPGSWAVRKEDSATERILVLAAKTTCEASSSLKAGKPILSKNSLRVAAKDYFLELCEIKPACKTVMSGAEYLRGKPVNAGTIFI